MTLHPRPSVARRAERDPPAVAAAAGGTATAGDWRDAVLAWSRAAAPREACGLLLGTRHALGWRVVQAVLGRNRAAQRDAFALDPGDFVHAHDAAAAAGLAVVGVWHSHVDAPPIPSRADRAAAWPDLLQVIVGPVRGAPAGIEAWQILAGGIVPVAL